MSNPGVGAPIARPSGCRPSTSTRRASSTLAPSPHCCGSPSSSRRRSRRLGCSWPRTLRLAVCASPPRTARGLTRLVRLCLAACATPSPTLRSSPQPSTQWMAAPVTSNCSSCTPLFRAEMGPPSRFRCVCRRRASAKTLGSRACCSSRHMLQAAQRGSTPGRSRISTTSFGWAAPSGTSVTTAPSQRRHVPPRSGSCWRSQATSASGSWKCSQAGWAAQSLLASASTRAL
mmetsp:Transcript_2032/g.4893  ORF Transcript_2032/g.4893 Transcript_2032/m.4893 type:complete len:231 (-) Transcript_2032:169-861(-)